MKTAFRILLASSVAASWLGLAACSSSGPDAIGTGSRVQLEPGGGVSSSGSASGATSSSSGGWTSWPATSSSGSSSGSTIVGPSSSSGSSSSSSSSGSVSGSSSSGSTSSVADAGSASDLQHCVDVINTYRATLTGVPAYTRTSALEDFAATGAQSDSQTGEAHGHFIGTNGGNGIAFAENEVPGWPLDQYGSVTAVIDQGMQMMWAEGPGGGHYDNMSSTQYTQAGCGIFVTSDNSVWITTDFR